MNRNLLKTMLVSTGLMAGVMGGYADVSTKFYDFEDDKAIFTQDSRVTVAVENDADLKSKVVTFTGANNALNGYCFAHYDFSSIVENANKITVSFDYWNTNGGRSIVSLGDAETRGTTGGSTKMTYSGTGALFRIGSDKYNFYINNNKLALANFCDKWLHVEVVVDLKTNKLSYVVKDKEGKELSTATDVDYFNAANACSQIDVFGYMNNSKMAKIDNLSITADIDTSVKYHTATFAEASGLQPKIKVYSDAECTAEVSPKSLEENATYYYVATLPGYEDYKGSFTVGTEDPSQSFTMTKKATFAYQVNLVNENKEILKTIYSNDAAYDGMSVSYSYPKYLTDETGKVTYVCDLSTFSGSATASKDNNQTIAYTAYKGTAYFLEGEKAINGTNVESANFSSGFAVRGFDDEKDLMTVADDGVYKITYSVCSNNVNNPRTLSIYANENEVVSKEVDWSLNYILAKGILSDVVSLKKDEVIKAKGSDTNIILDYVLLEKLTGDDVNVSSIKYATYVPTCNVVAPADVKIYTAKVNEAKSAVVLSEVTAGSVIPAGTPVLVGADEGTYSFSVSTDEVSTIGENELLAANNTKGDGKTIYALVNKAGQPVFALMKEGVKLTPGTAYLKIDDASVACYSIAFGGSETTGINGVNTISTKTNDSYYTLQGVKTSKPIQGVYIHNGKKIVIK